MRRVWIGLLLLAFAGCEKDNYRPVYYPDRSNLRVSISGPTFDSLEMAQGWAQETACICSDENWDYEIGKNFIEWIGGPDGVGIYEETVR